jgi:membrane fusion protein (multidrug efflux system)
MELLCDKHASGKALIRLTLFIVIVLPAISGTTLPDRDIHAAQPTFGTHVKAVRAARSDDAHSTLSGMGTIRSSNQIDVGFDGTGVVSVLAVKEGDRVEKGQVLAELDSSVLESEIAVKEAEAEAVLAEANYYREEFEKQKELYEKQAVSDKEMKKAEYEMRKAEAQLKRLKAEQESLKVKRKQRILRAPMSGIVAELYVDRGSVVTPGAHKVIRLIRSDEVIADIDLGESLFLLVRPGQKVRLKVDALRGKEFWGKVDRISPEIHKKQRTFTMHTRVRNPDLTLVPGMFVRAEILPAQTSAPVRIPVSAVLHDKKKANEIYVVKDGVAVRRSVRLGEQEEGRVQVLNGLEEGEIVLVEGHKDIPNLTEVSVSFLESD